MHEALTYLLKGAKERMSLDPFPHAIVQPALPWEFYEELEARFPEPHIVVKQRKKVPNTLYQYHARDVLNDDNIDLKWRQFFYEAVSREFYDAVGALFGEFPDGESRVRFRSGIEPIELDCLFGVNTPVEKRGSVKGPHLDNPKEVYACLIYFPEKDDAAGGDLGLYRYNKDEPRFFGQRFTTDVEMVKRVEYDRNTAIIFKNTANSVHGVLPRDPTDKWRRYCNLEAEFARPLFEVPR